MADAPTSHPGLLAWVREVAELTTPESIVWCDGSDAEWGRLTGELVAAGTLVPLNSDIKPNSFWAKTDPTDVARVEERTFICSVDEADAGPTNNWMAPADMKREMTELYRGCMRGRTMYVIPFCMGPLTAENPMFGVEITDSAYVVALDADHDPDGCAGPARRWATTPTSSRPCTRSAHRSSRVRPTCAWPCNETKYISHFPETREIWSYGSGYGGNSLLGKKCYSLRIASVMARDEGWLAEHMLILKLTSPEGKVYYIAAAFPSACGKTNLAMLEPTIPGWKVETLGDDIAWMRFGNDGRLYAVNPEYGLFGVAPGTDWKTNPNAMRTIAKGNSLFTNVARTDDGDIWWEGMGEPPAHLIDWHGDDWTPEIGRAVQPPELPLLHADQAVPDPRRRVRRPERRADRRDPLRRPPQDHDPAGHRGPRLGARRLHGRDAVLRDHRRGGRPGRRGPPRPDGDAAVHRLQRRRLLQALDRDGQGRRRGPATPTSCPKIFYVNWFRRGDDGQFLWPGFGENCRVLKWVVERLEGTAAAVETPIGAVPDAGVARRRPVWTCRPADLEAALRVDPDEWRAEIPQITEWFETVRRQAARRALGRARRAQGPPRRR